MRSFFIISAVVFQILVLGWMAGEREWIVRTGPSFWLRTAPVDPRDLFRGDYVRLNYDISTIPREKFGPELKTFVDDLPKTGSYTTFLGEREIPVYVALTTNPETGVAEVVSVDRVPPPSGSFLKGRVCRYDAAASRLSGIEYGIDAYFVEQGKGRELERRAPVGTPDGIQAPLQMEVAVGRNGTAVLKDHRWSPLGIGAKVMNADEQGQVEGRKNKIIRVTLCNTSSTPQVVVWPNDLSTLHLQSIQDGEDEPGPQTPLDDTRPTVARKVRDKTPHTDADMRVLQPGQTLTADLDPADPRWVVKDKESGKWVSLTSREARRQSFRVVYQPPAPSACSGLKDVNLIAQDPCPANIVGQYELTE